MMKRFHKSLLESGCLPPGSRVLVAVSGGADSVALLSLLHNLSDSLNLSLEVAHLDHSLRPESCADAGFVETLCAELNLPLTLERQDVARLARERRGNLEEVARDVRRDFLLRTARARGCGLIALGHHADDQAETFLQRLLRGSRGPGLAGMRAVKGLVVRPLLPFARTEVLAYLQAEGLAWREDKSNLDQAFTRNRIRHHLLPTLESFNPNISRHLAGLCEQLQQDEDFWADLVGQELARCGKLVEGALVLDRPALLGAPPALAGRLIRAALGQVRGDLRGLTAVHISDILSLVDEGPPQGELDLPGAWVARRYDSLLFRKARPEAVMPFCVELTGPGDWPLPDGRVLKILLDDKSQGGGRNVVEFAAAGVAFPLLVRHCLPGDRLQPSGMAGTKKLQDLFVDLKLTREERRGSLVLLQADEILWAVDLRRSEGRFPVSGEPVLRFVVETEIDA